MSLTHLAQDNWLVNSTCTQWIKSYIKWVTSIQHVLYELNYVLNELHVFKS